MNAHTVVQYLLCSILVLAQTVSSALAADKVKSYSNTELGFSFQYPASWVIVPTSIPNLRVKIAAPSNTPSAECSVIVKHYPKAATAKQSDIDQVFTEPPTKAELEEVLSQGNAVVKVLKASAGNLHVRPAHIARFQYQSSQNTYASGQLAMTATPGYTWSISCSGQGEEPKKAEQNFQYWQSKINTLVSSFRFK